MHLSEGRVQLKVSPKKVFNLQGHAPIHTSNLSSVYETT